MIGKLTPQQIEQVLHSEVLGRIGCHCEGLTYIVPVTYAYDGARILAHSADGMKVQMMRSNPSVCFQVDQVDNMANWRSVVTWGNFRELDGDDAALAMSFLVDRIRPMTTSETASPNMHHSGPYRSVVYEIKLKEKTGRFERR